MSMPICSRPLYVPVNVAGEASGTVTLEDKGTKTGQGRVIVNFFTDRLKYAGRTLTENDGYFSLFGSEALAIIS